MQKLALSFEPANGGVRVVANGAGRKAEHCVSPAALANVERQANRLMERFETGPRPLVDPVALRELGQLLHVTYLKPFPDGSVAFKDDGPGQVLVSSKLAHFLNLPWEVLPDSNGGFLAEAPQWTIRRSHRPDLPPSAARLVAPPLRILFTACAPTDQTGLDYEREEEAILRIADRLGALVHLEIAETGTFDELGQLISELKPHVVHLSGHGIMRNGVGHFTFEEERGRSDLRDAHEIARQVFAGRGVRLVFVSGCQTGQAGAAGVCQALVAEGHVPLVVGWGASIADSLATEFARVFFHELASGMPVDRAMAGARLALFARCRLRQGVVDVLDASFALPRLYAAEDTNDLLDSQLAPERPVRPGVRYELLGDNIRGLREGFVGRRRVLQRTRPAMRAGEVHVLLLTGIGGAGKSTLATRLANRARQDGFRVVALRAGQVQTLPFGLRLVGELATACQRLGREGDERMLRDGQRPLGERLRLAAEILNEAKLLLVLDNLEELVAQPPAAPGWQDAEFAVFFQELASRLTGEGRAILTCRYVPDGFDPRQPNLAHEPMPDFTEADFLKYLRRHDRVAERIERGQLTPELLSSFYQKLGGTPRFVEQAAAVLATASPDRLAEQLEGLAAPDPVAPDDELKRMQQDYFNDLFLPQLYESLPAESRLALSRLAMVELPLPLDGVARVAALPEPGAAAALEQWLQRSLAQRFGEADETPLYAIYPLQRSFLTGPARLPAAEQAAAHGAAAGFFQECFERKREEELRMPIPVELIACLTHAEASGDLERVCWAAVKLALRMQRRAEFQASLELLEPLLQRDRHHELLVQVANIMESLGRWKEARAHYEEALAMLQAIGDRAGEATTWHNLATIDLNEGNYPAAREKFGKALATEQAIGEQAGETATWHQLASIDLNEGNYPAAREKFDKALAMRQAIGDQAGEAATWHQLATIDVNEGNYAAARERFGKALAMFQASGDRAGEAATWHQLATIDVHEGNYAAAREKSGKSVAIRQAIGDPAGEAATWHNLATIDLREGNHAAAREKFGKALAMRQAIGYRAGEAATLYQIDVVAWERGRRVSGIRLVCVCLGIEKAIGSGGVNETMQGLTDMAQELGLDEARLETLVKDSLASYAQDRGASLVREAFEGI